MSTPVIAFDINETLLDLGALDPLFERLFGATAARGQWFQTLLHWSLVSSATGQFHDFSVLASAGLETLATAYGVDLPAPARDEVMAAVKRLPPHPEVAPALAGLRAQGLRLAALTNSAQATVDTQLARAGLGDYFERVLSVDAVQRYKPHPQVYRYAARELGVEADGLWLVAAHDWDVTGAIRAGCRGALVLRPGKAPHPCGERPDIVAPDLEGVTAQLIRRFAR